jgi:transposase-like protein
MRKTPKKYSNEFKRDALLLLAKSGKSKAELERELGLSHGLLLQWQRKFEVSADKPGLDLSEVEQLKAENRRLKRENAILQEEREILKKKVSIFSKGQQG